MIKLVKKILKENYVYMIIILALIILLSVIMRSSLHDEIIIFDYKVIDFMKRINHVKLTSLLSFMTNFGDLYIPLIILVCILIFIKNKWYFILQTCGYLIAGAITFITKLLASRARPIEALIEIPKSFSFPSGHTLTSLVFYSLLCYLLTINCRKNTKAIFFTIYVLLIIIIAVSRIYLGVHYFSDVVGGFIIGIPCLMMIINIIEKNFKENLK